MVYERSAERKGPVTLPVRLYQGAGALPNTYKDFAFNTFLLFFYNQVLGLPAAQASLAIMLAILLDAITDPLVGSYSDRLKSRLGRRHPLMYGAALPLGIAMTLVFLPPQGLSDSGLFWWLLITVAAARTAMTFFLVPWSALFAELSERYEERTTLLAYRYLIGFIGGITLTWCTWTFIFPATSAYPTGQLNPNRYWILAVVVGALVTFFAFFTTHMTRSEIPYLLQPDTAKAYRIRYVIDDFLSALKNRDYLVLFVGLLVASAITGTLAALEIYLNTYFWELKGEDLRWLSIATAGALLAFISVPLLQKHVDKKNLLIASMLLSLTKGLLVINLRFLDVLPENGTTSLLTILVINEFIGAYLLTITVMMFISMVADTLDAQELATGKRQEGVFSAAISFSAKATTGLGVMLSGLVLEFLVGFPTQVSPQDIQPELVMRLGLVIGVAIPLLYLIPFYMARRYDISRQRHQEIRMALDTQRAHTNGTAAAVPQGLRDP